MLSKQYIESFITRDNYISIMPKIIEVFKRYKQEILDKYDIKNPDTFRYSLSEEDCKKRIFISAVMENVFDTGDLGNLRTFQWFTLFIDFLNNFISTEESIKEEEDYIRCSYMDYVETLRCFYTNTFDDKETFDKEFITYLKDFYVRLIKELESILK